MTAEDKYQIGLKQLLDRLDLADDSRIATSEIPQHIMRMFYERDADTGKITKAVESLGYSHACAHEWVIRWLNTIAHGND